MITADVEVAEKNFTFLLETKARKNLLYGSAGSAKSWAIAQFLLFEKFIQYPYSGIRILIIRKTGPALKDSCWQLMLDLIELYEIPDVKVNKSDLSLTWCRNKMIFKSLDDPNKIKSFERPNYIWIEEVIELTVQEYRQICLRLRGGNPIGVNQLFASFNPNDENSFLKDVVDNPPDDTAVCHSTYKDNPFNEPEYVAEIEGLQVQDWTYWLIYGLGIWATPTGIIYSNWDIVKDANWPTGFDEIIYGLDFGFTNPSALIEISIREMDLYIKELIYEKHLTTPMLISEMSKYPQVQNGLIYADSAQPATIEEIANDGRYAIQPADKGPNSVIEGIRAVMAYKLHIHEESVNLQKEIRGYKWRAGKNGDVLDKEMPVKFNDHLCDSLRMGVFTHGGANTPISLSWLK